jgi:hypothetical protein
VFRHLELQLNYLINIIYGLGAEDVFGLASRKTSKHIPKLSV